ncbi:hypothetical protein QBC39DRAFT_6513 [Podospora conica]|nr:hypothetical protein QBC39DRAFT_6513 [Schizothecium conicum]
MTDCLYLPRSLPPPFPHCTHLPTRSAEMEAQACFVPVQQHLLVLHLPGGHHSPPSSQGGSNSFFTTRVAPKRGTTVQNHVSLLDHHHHHHIVSRVPMYNRRPYQPHPHLQPHPSTTTTTPGPRWSNQIITPPLSPLVGVPPDAQCDAHAPCLPIPWPCIAFAGPPWLVGPPLPPGPVGRGAACRRRTQHREPSLLLQQHVACSHLCSQQQQQQWAGLCLRRVRVCAILCRWWSMTACPLHSRYGVPRHANKPSSRTVEKPPSTVSKVTHSESRSHQSPHTQERKEQVPTRARTRPIPQPTTSLPPPGPPVSRPQFPDNNTV